MPLRLQRFLAADAAHHYLTTAQPLEPTLALSRITRLAAPWGKFAGRVRIRHPCLTVIYEGVLIERVLRPRGTMARWLTIILAIIAVVLFFVGSETGNLLLGVVAVAIGGFALGTLAPIFRDRLPEGSADPAFEARLRELEERLRLTEERLGLSEDELADAIRKIDGLESAAEFDRELRGGSARLELPSSNE